MMKFSLIKIVLFLLIIAYGLYEILYNDLDGVVIYVLIFAVISFLVEIYKIMKKNRSN